MSNNTPQSDNAAAPVGSGKRACDHPRMSDPTGPDAGTCEVCGAVCTCDDDEQPWAGDADCPVHGEE